MPDIFRVMLTMNVVPGRGNDFEKAWHDGASIITDEPANLGQWLSRSADEEGVYYIVSDWTSEDDFRIYELSDRHLEHRKTLHPYRSHGSMETAHLLFSMAS